MKRLIALFLISFATTIYGAQVNFSGWLIYDDPTVYKLNTDENFIVDHHGDEDLYFYEPSGLAGLMLNDFNDRNAFYELEQFIIDGIKEFGNLNEGKAQLVRHTLLKTFQEATYTYLLGKFYIPENYKGTVELDIGYIDDGVMIIVNGHIIGFKKLSDELTTYDLNVDKDKNQGVLQAGENTIILIVVDDSTEWKIFKDIQLYANDFGNNINEYNLQRMVYFK